MSERHPLKVVAMANAKYSDLAETNSVTIRCDATGEFTVSVSDDPWGDGDVEIVIAETELQPNVKIVFLDRYGNTWGKEAQVGGMMGIK